jgi:DNA-3-methyladenine glycosylase II
VVPDGLAKGIAALKRRDPDFGRILEIAGRPRFPRRPRGFGSLLHIILGQQVSVDAAAAMYRRLESCCIPLAPEPFLALDDATLRQCGFSRQKMAYGRGLAEAIRDRRFDPPALDALDDEAVVAALVALKGIGRWTAEVYLLFAMARPDIWPADDLGLQLGLQWLKDLPERPRGAGFRAVAEAWRPWRSVAACLLWQFYLHRLNRLPAQRPPVPAATALIASRAP